MSSRRSRKNHQEYLDSLVASCHQNNQPYYGDEDVLDRVIFKNNEATLEVKKGRFVFNSGDADYSNCQFHIDSPIHWHKITVS